MASKKTLTAANLEALGAPRLAELLLEIAKGDAAAQRRLRMAIAAPEQVAAEVRKRLAQIERSTAFLDGPRVRALAADLDTQRRAIVEQVAKIDAGEALELMWRFLELAGGEYERSDDRSRLLDDVFDAACRDLGPLAEKAKPDPLALADQVFDALDDNRYSQYDALLETLAPTLGDKGLDHLKARFGELSRLLVVEPPPGSRGLVLLGPGGPFYATDANAGVRAHAKQVLQEIANLQGDVDGFIDQYGEEARKAPATAAVIARRLLEASRASDALEALDAVERTAGQRGHAWMEYGWEEARIEVLDALGRTADAQALRWSCFEGRLSAPHLRAWLDRLPDFEDDEGERRALDHAARCPSLMQALSFLVSWNAHDRAAQLVIDRQKELDGDHYEVLTPAAEALAEKHPLAATLLLRAMVEFALVKARAGRYRHAARHLTECATLSTSIQVFEPFETHEIWSAHLRSKHGGKWGFWSIVSGG
jgi:hypothetical protein